MERFVIDISENISNKHKDSIKVSELEKIFTEIGQLISENEVVITCLGGMRDEQSFDAKPSTNKRPLLAIPLITNTYDRMKYINGYSKDIIPIFIRAEVRLDTVSHLPDNFYYNDMPENPAGNLWEKHSPEKYLEPVDIPEKSAIMTMISDGYLPLIIGPGFSVIKELQYYREYPGTIGMDASSSLLATLIDANELIIITKYDVNSFNDSISIRKMSNKISYKALLDLYTAGQFTSMDMEIKIRSMLNFISKGGKKSILKSINLDTIIEVLP
jgi:carbamate kinase